MRDDRELAGRTVAGRYELKERIGEGAMGVVYLAADLGRRSSAVAVKFLLQERARDPDEVRRFRVAARAAARLRSEFIVRVLDHGTDEEGVPFLVMPYLGDQTLWKAVTDGTVGEQEGLALIDDLADALSIAARNGVVHRDVKPQNVMLEQCLRRGRRIAILLDFDLVSRRNVDPRPGRREQPCGSPSTMAPEQWRGKRPAAPMDVYALGVLLYFVVTGMLPFRSPDWRLLAVQHCRDAAPALRRDGRTWSEALERLVRDMLAKDPLRRPTIVEARLRLRSCPEWQAARELCPGRLTLARRGVDERLRAATLRAVPAGAAALLCALTLLVRADSALPRAHQGAAPASPVAAEAGRLPPARGDRAAARRVGRVGWPAEPAATALLASAGPAGGVANHPAPARSSGPGPAPAPEPTLETPPADVGTPPAPAPASVPAPVPAVAAAVRPAADAPPRVPGGLTNEEIERDLKNRAEDAWRAVWLREGPVSGSGPRFLRVRLDVDGTGRVQVRRVRDTTGNPRLFQAFRATAERWRLRPPASGRVSVVVRLPG